MNSVLQMMNSVLQMMNSVLKMMNVQEWNSIRNTGDDSIALWSDAHPDLSNTIRNVSKSDGSRIQNETLCIKNEELCIKRNAEFCIYNVMNSAELHPAADNRERCGDLRRRCEVQSISTAFRLFSSD